MTKHAVKHKRHEDKEEQAEPKKQQRYVHVNKVEQRKKEGWKVIDSDYSDVTESQAYRKNLQAHGDLVLMEKE